MGGERLGNTCQEEFLPKSVPSAYTAVLNSGSNSLTVSMGSAL